MITWGKRVEKGSGCCSADRSQEWFVFNLVNSCTVLSATLGRLLRDRAEHLWAFSSAMMLSWVETGIWLYGDCHPCANSTLQTLKYPPVPYSTFMCSRSLTVTVVRLEIWIDFLPPFLPLCELVLLCTARIFPFLLWPGTPVHTHSTVRWQAEDRERQELRLSPC